MNKLSIISKTAAILSLGSLVLTPSIGAQTQSTNSSTAVGIEVSAPLYEYTIKPGENVQDIIKVKNVGPNATTFYPEVLDFKSNNEDGTPIFLKSGEDSGTYSLAKWISFTKESVTIEPNKSEAFNFFVTIPADAEPGGHYAGILFSTQPPKLDGTGLSLATKVGSLVLVRVAGDAKEEASIKEFSTDKETYEQAQVKFNLVVSNTGNVHVQPKGTITIKNIFGGTVAALDVNQSSSNVLPGSDRKFAIDWEDPGFKVGYYTATVTLNYGNPSQTITAQVTFWILPWKTLLIALVVAIILLVLLTLAVKRYNAWIVSRANGSNKIPPPPPPAQ
jgi:hypothetical protein